MKGIVENKQDKKKTIMYNFTNQRSNNIGRQRRADVVKGRPSPVPKARNTPEPVDAFHMFLIKEMFELIVENTNRKINNLLASISEETIADIRIYESHST